MSLTHHAQAIAFEPPHPWGEWSDGLASVQSRPKATSPWLDRVAVAEAITAHHRRLNIPAHDAWIEALKHPEGAWVVGGQQPGLLLGAPLVIYKAVMAIRVAQKLTRQWQVPVAAAFWLASEDHDIQEVNHVTMRGQKFTLEHSALEQGGPRPPVGAIDLSAHRDRVIAFVAESLVGLQHRDWVMSMVESAPWTSYADQFGHLMAHVFRDHPLALVDPMALRSLTAPFLKQAAAQWPALTQAFDQGAAQMRSMGVKPPLEQLGLFNLQSGHRLAVEDPTAVDFSTAWLSPGAGLRPVMQDAVLPVVATVAGPTESLYLRQIDPLFAVMGVKRSVLVPRGAATVMDHTTAALANQLALAGSDLLQVAESDDPGQVVSHSDLQRLEQLCEQLVSHLDTLSDDALSKQLTKARESITHQVGRVIDRVTQVRLESAGRGRKQRRRLAEVVRPGGQPQEREPGGALMMLATHGPAWIDTLMKVFDPDRCAHHVITMGGPSVEKQS